MEKLNNGVVINNNEDEHAQYQMKRDRILREKRIEDKIDAILAHVQRLEQSINSISDRIN